MHHNILVTGGTGQIGKRLVRALLKSGVRVSVVSRNLQHVELAFGNQVNGIHGDPTIPGKWQEAINGMDAVVHLAGENVASHRWTASVKEAIRSSRVNSTHNIVHAINNASIKPRTLVLASAIGWYGKTSDSGVDESASCGSDFLAQVCCDWEAASEPVIQIGLVRVIIRVGIVLEREYGAFAKLVSPIKWGIGGPLAGGRFFMSWIHCDDLCRLFLHALAVPNSIILNGVAPKAVRNHELVSALSQRLHRWAIVPVPYVALRLLIGEFAQYLCTNQNVLPKSTLASGFSYKYPEINSALADLLDTKN